MLRMKVFHKGLVLVCVPLLLGLLLVSSLYILLQKSEEEMAKEMIYREGAATVARIIGVTSEIPMLLTLAIEFHSDKMFNEYKKDLVMLDNLMKGIDRLIALCPEVNVGGKEELQKGQAKVLAISAKFAELKDSKGASDDIAKFLAMVDDIDVVAGSLTNQLLDLAKMSNEQTAQIRLRQDQIQNAEKTILLIGLLLNAAAGIALAFFYRSSILNRLASIRSNTAALARGEAMSPALGGSDEIALLDHAFRTMQEQLALASRRERALFDNASDVICVLNEQNQFLKVNPICKQFWGYDQAELELLPLAKLFDPQDFTELEREIAKAKSSGAAGTMECKILSREGQSREMLWSLYWSADEQSLFCTVHDLSAQKKLERAKEQYMQMISKNLMLPLNSISASLKRLIGRRLDGAAPRNGSPAISRLELANSNVDRMLILVDDLLRMNELQGRVELHQTNCRIDASIERAVRDLETPAKSKQIKFQIDLPEAQEWFVDQNRILQVLVNLISNAIKFSPADSIIKLWARREGDFIRCAVEDKGRGLPSDQTAAIFDKFVQVKAADGKRAQGTGLGLPICKQIIEQHKGIISAENLQEGGCRFSFQVPVDEGTRNKIAGAKIACEKSLPKAVPAEIPSDAKTEIAVRRESSRLNLAGKGAILVGVPIIGQVALVALLTTVLMNVDKERVHEAHERRIMEMAGHLMSHVLDAQLKMSHGDVPENWQRVLKDMKNVEFNKSELKRLVKKDKKESKQMVYIESKLRKLEESFENAKAKRNNPKEFYDAITSLKERQADVPNMLMFFRSVQRLVKIAEDKEFESPIKQQELRGQLGQLLLIGLAANVISSLLLAVFFSRDINSRLMLLADNASRLAANKELHPPIGGADEIAELDKLFHSTASALRQARNKGRSIIDNSQEIICVLDQHGNFLSINPACQKIWGYQSDDLLAEKSLLDLTIADDMEMAKSAIAKDLPASSQQFESRILKASGEPIHMLWSVSRDKNEPLLFCVAHDISSRKELEQLKRDLLAMVSHDLRTPLASILANCQLAAAGVLGEMNKDDLALLDQINIDGSKLIELINDLLDLEKLEAGKMQLLLENVSLSKIMSSSLNAISSNARHVRMELAENAELQVKADAERLIRAISNVLSCCSPAQDLEVKVLKLEKEVELQIESSGLLQSNELPETGNGLALSLANKILNGHGASLVIDEKGCSIKLPITKEN